MLTTYFDCLVDTLFSTKNVKLSSLLNAFVDWYRSSNVVGTACSDAGYLRIIHLAFYPMRLERVKARTDIARRWCTKCHDYCWIRMEEQGMVEVEMLLACGRIEFCVLHSIEVLLKPYHNPDRHIHDDSSVNVVCKNQHLKYSAGVKQ